MQSLHIRYHTYYYVIFLTFNRIIFDSFLIFFYSSYLYHIFCIEISQKNVFVSFIIVCIVTKGYCRLFLYFNNKNSVSFISNCVMSSVNMYMFHKQPFIICLAIKINNGLHLYYNNQNFLQFNKVYSNIFSLCMVLISIFTMDSIPYITQINAIYILRLYVTMLLPIKHIYVWKYILLVTYTSLHHCRGE